MKKIVMWGLVAAVATAAIAQGFDANGYNYKARIFSGKADGSDANMDGTIWGDATYANDHLVMKWSKEWDDARFKGKPWTPGAWLTNHWNGNVAGGSGNMSQYKIIWVGPDLENSPHWRPGGYAIWDEFEVIFDHGTDPNNNHVWWAHAVPSGLGK